MIVAYYLLSYTILMNYLIKFSHAIADSQLPDIFPSPFNLQPHPVARLAAEQLQQMLNASLIDQYDFSAPNAGKMFGVLVVKTEQNELGFLAAFAGAINEQWCVPGFVPPVFNAIAYETELTRAEHELNDLRVIDNLTPRMEYVEDSAHSDRPGRLVVEEEREVLVVGLNVPFAFSISLPPEESRYLVLRGAGIVFR